MITALPTSKPRQRQQTLADLPPGQPARITKLDLAGQARWRLNDLGFLPGTRVESELASPMNDPVAYRVRGALIALRTEQAERIYVECDESP